MITLGVPIVLTLFLWWFSTGAILYLDTLRPQTFRWSMIGATAVFALTLFGVARTAGDATPAGACAAFCFGLLAWGWQLASFYLGYITGPRRTACEESLTGWPRFIEAVRTGLYHELTAIASAGLIAVLAWGAPNKTAVWTFLLLWAMHLSAKLNIYFGVPSLNEEMLPPHLTYLVSFMRRKPMNHFFPLSITAATVVTTVLVQRALQPLATPYAVTSNAILATLMALAIVEHWLLVTPHQINAIWRWRPSSPNVDVALVQTKAATPVVVPSTSPVGVLQTKSPAKAVDDDEYSCAASW